MHPTVVPNSDEGDERRLKEASEDQRKAAVERTLPNQVADRTKRQVDKQETPQSSEK